MGRQRKKKYIQVTETLNKSTKKLNKKQEEQRKQKKQKEQEKQNAQYLYFNQNEEFIKSVCDFLSVIENPKHSSFIKISKTVYTDTKAIVYDIKLNRKKEDNLYFKFPWFIKNIRRGLSIVSKYKEDFNLDQLVYTPVEPFRILRKGLPKFFDLNLIELGFKQDIKAKTAVLGFFQNLPKKEQIKSFPIKMFLCEKSNGENFQASYDKELDKFVICSKNVSFLVGCEKDVHSFENVKQWNQNEQNTKGSNDFYFKQRFSFAKLMAITFFKKVSKLTPEKMKQLKEFLAEYTMVGEYCGNPEFQHLVKYYEIDLEIFAFVNKHTEQMCISPTESVQIAEKFGFTHVEITTFISNDLEQLKTQLTNVQTDVFFNKSKSDSEGAVLYIESAEKEITHLVKLKTMDYRMKRKLREKIRGLVPSQQKKSDKIPTQKSVIAKYKKELKKMCKDYEKEMKEEIAYYLAFGDFLIPLSLEMYEKNIRVVDRYVDFLVIAKPFFEMKYLGIEFDDMLAFKLMIKAFRNPEFLERLNKIYSNRLLEKSVLEDLKKEFGLSNINDYSLVSPYKIMAFIPLGILGSGKSFLREEIIENFAIKNGFWGGFVSSDKAGLETIERMKSDPNIIKVNKDDCFDVAFQKSFFERKMDFDRRMNEEINQIEIALKKRRNMNQKKLKLKLKKIKTDDQEREISEANDDSDIIPKKFKEDEESNKIEDEKILEDEKAIFVNEGEDSSADEIEEKPSIFSNKKLFYIDKNHPLNNSLKFAIKKYSTFPTTFDMVMVGLIPKRLKEFDISKWNFFDDKTLFISLHNVINRKYHETLNTSIANRLNIFLLFVNFFSREKKMSLIMKHYIEYPLDFDVYQKKHESIINLPENEEENRAKDPSFIYEKKLNKNDFVDFTNFLKELTTFKLHNDKTDRIKIVDKKLAMIEEFLNKMKKLEAYKKIVKMMKSTVIDYSAKSEWFKEDLISKIVDICQLPDKNLQNWMEERKSIPLYLCFYSDMSRGKIRSNLFNTIKSYKKEFPKFSKKCNVFYEVKDEEETMNSNKGKKKKKKDKQNNSIKMKNINDTQSLHVTLKFFHDYTKEDFELIENFRDRVHVDLEISHFIFIKDCLLTLIVNETSHFQEVLNKIGIKKSQNEVQHITFAVGSKVKAFESNAVLDQLYQRLDEKGRTIQDIKKVESFDKVYLPSKKKEFKVFVVEMIEKMTLEAFSSRFLRK